VILWFPEYREPENQDDPTAYFGHCGDKANAVQGPSVSDVKGVSLCFIWNCGRLANRLEVEILCEREKLNSDAGAK
jgi:hypothetical protein